MVNRVTNSIEKDATNEFTLFGEVLVDFLSDGKTPENLPLAGGAHVLLSPMPN